jgi:hypothetical protein
MSTIATINAASVCSVSGMGCQILLIADAAWNVNTSGNVKNAFTAITGNAYLLTYDNGTSTWYLESPFTAATSAAALASDASGNIIAATTTGSGTTTVLQTSPTITNPTLQDASSFTQLSFAQNAATPPSTTVDNYIQIQNAGTATPPAIVTKSAGSSGGDSNVGLAFSNKGTTGSWGFYSGTTLEYQISGAGKVTEYGGTATTSNGVSATVAATSHTSQTAAITGDALFTPTATGRYTVHYSAKVTTADPVSSTLGGSNGFQVVYTDPSDSSTPTAIGGTCGNTANSTTSACGGAVSIYAAAAAVTVNFGYTSHTSGDMAYQIYVWVTQE